MLSHVQLFVTPIDCNGPGFWVLHYFLEYMQALFSIMAVTEKMLHKFKSLFLVQTLNITNKGHENVSHGKQ